MLDTGVRSSWATSATKLRRCLSASSKLAAMELNARANCRISVAPSAGARWEKSPRPNCCAASPRVFTGASNFLDKIETNRVPKATAASPVQSRDWLTAETKLAAAGSEIPWGPILNEGSRSTENEPTCVLSTKTGTRPDSGGLRLGRPPTRSCESPIISPFRPRTIIRRPANGPACSRTPCNWDSSRLFT